MIDKSLALSLLRAARVQFSMGYISTARALISAARMAGGVA